MDISSNFLFTSVSNGYVYRSSLSKMSVSEPILRPNNIFYKPLDLSVDWLNRHLYVLGEVYYTKESLSNSTLFSNWEIIRCDFDGKNQIVALSGFNSRPLHFEVDAYNGWVLFCSYVLRNYFTVHKKICLMEPCMSFIMTFQQVQYQCVLPLRHKVYLNCNKIKRTNRDPRMNSQKHLVPTILPSYALL